MKPTRIFRKLLRFSLVFLFVFSAVNIAILSLTNQQVRPPKGLNEHNYIYEPQGRRASTVGEISLENYIIELANFMMDPALNNLGWYHYHEGTTYSSFSVASSSAENSGFWDGTLGVYYALEGIATERSGDTANNANWVKLPTRYFDWDGEKIERVINRWGLKANEDGGNWQVYVYNNAWMKVAQFEQPTGSYSGYNNYTGLNGLAGLMLGGSNGPSEIGETGDKLTQYRAYISMWLRDSSKSFDDGCISSSQVYEADNCFKWPYVEGTSDPLDISTGINMGAAGIIWAFSRAWLDGNYINEGTGQTVIQKGANWLINIDNGDGNGAQVVDDDGDNNINGYGRLKWRYTDYAGDSFNTQTTIRYGSLGIIESLLSAYECLKDKCGSTQPLILNAAKEGINYLRAQGLATNCVEYLEVLHHLYQLENNATFLAWMEEAYNALDKTDIDGTQALPGYGLLKVSTNWETAKAVYLFNRLYHITSNNTYLTAAREAVNWLMYQSQSCKDTNNVVGDGNGAAWMSCPSRGLAFDQGIAGIIYYLMKATLGSERLSLLQDQTEPEMVTITFPGGDTLVGNSTDITINVNDTQSGVKKAFVYLDNNWTDPKATWDFPSAVGDHNFILNAADLTTGVNHSLNLNVTDIKGNSHLTVQNFTVDNQPPLITDNQMGDDTWRSAAGTTYDVDFSDVLSVLNYSQYKITTAPAQGGTVLKDWTNIFAGLGAASYTTDWTLDFAACQEGTNYISVRVYDNESNSVTRNDVFYVRKDVTNPTITEYQAGDDTWRSAAGTTYNVDFADATSLLNYAQYKITTAPAQGGTVLKDWTDIFAGLGASSYTTNWTIDFAGCQEGTNYVSVQVYDYAGLSTTLNDVFYVRKDVTNPTITNYQAGDDTWRTAAGTTYNVDFADAGSLLNYAQYRITTAPAQGGMVRKDWTNIFTGLGAASYTTDWTIDFAACQEGTNYVSVRVYDYAGFSTTSNDVFYVRKDITNPTITNYQAGDDTWRTAAGTTYNIDFADASSLLNYAQYKITTAPAQGGTVQKDWTDIFAGLGAASYTTDWTVDFSACQEGINYVSVRIYDYAGLSITLNDSFYVRKDVTNPTITDYQTGDYTWRNAAGTTYDVDFADVVSLLSYAQYKITTAPAQGGTVRKDWTDIFTGLGAASYTINWTIDFAACQEGINYVSVRVYDYAGLSATFNDVFYLKKDTSTPIIVINNPGGTAYSSAPTMDVDFSDAPSGLINGYYKVDSYLPLGLDSTNWVEIFTNLGGSDYVIDFLLDQDVWTSLAEGSHFVYFKVWDNASNVNDGSSPSWQFYKDTLKPSLSLLSPQNDTLQRPGTEVQFNINDNLGIASVVYNWNYSSNQTLASPYRVTCPLVEGIHWFYIYAFDFAGNLENNTYRFLINVPPSIILSTPGNNTIQNSSVNVAMSITDNEGIVDAKYNWDGGANTTLVSPYNLAMIGSEGIHDLFVFAIDGYGEWSMAHFRFSIDNTIPHLELVTPANNSVGKTGTSIQFNIWDNVQVSNAWYKWDSGANNPLISPYSVGLTASEGSHSLQIFVMDAAQNLVTESYNFIVDNSAPQVMLVDPLDLSVHSSSIPISFTIYDDVSSVAQVLFNWDYSANNEEGTFPYSTMLPSLYGSHSLLVIASDPAGNSVNRRYVFYMDTKGPAIALYAILQYAVLKGGTTITLDISDEYSLINQVLIRWDGKSEIPLEPLNYVTTLPESEGPHTLFVRTQDTLGNWENSSFTLKTDNTAPEVTYLGIQTGVQLFDGSNISITAMDLNGIASIEINRSVSITLKGEPIVIEKYPTYPQFCDYLFSFNATNLTPRTYFITISVKDIAGNEYLETIEVTYAGKKVPLPLGSFIIFSIIAGTIIAIGAYINRNKEKEEQNRH